MNFIHFKKKFIELYNQQKFQRFSKSAAQIVAEVDFEDVDAPTLYEAVTMAIEENDGVLAACGISIDDARIDIYEFFETLFSSGDVDELRAALASDATLTTLQGANFGWLIFPIRVHMPAVGLNSSVAEDFVPSDIKTAFTVDLRQDAPNASEPFDLSSVTDDLAAFAVTADLTFFVYWVDLEAELTEAIGVNVSKDMHYTIALDIGVVDDMREKFAIVAAMRSRTERYVSEWAEGQTLADVANITVYNFAYDEL